MNRNSEVPLYQQIVEDLKYKIINGTLIDGDKLMTEIDLMKTYKVSRITVRRAIEILTDEGYVTKRQGIGTFVTKSSINRKFTNSNKIMSFTETCKLEGKTSSSKLISLEWMCATPLISQSLNIEEGEQVLKIVRIRMIDDNPVMLEKSYYPSKYGFLCGENLTGSIYESLRKHGISMFQAMKTIKICYATKEEAEYLNVSSGQALLLHKDHVIDTRGEPIHLSYIIVNPERYKLTISIKEGL